MKTVFRELALVVRCLLAAWMIDLARRMTAPPVRDDDVFALVAFETAAAEALGAAGRHLDLACVEIPRLRFGQ